MAALAPLRVDCPVCGEPIEVPLTVTTNAVNREATVATAIVSTDLSPISDHAVTHQEA